MSVVAPLSDATLSDQPFSVVPAGVAAPRFRVAMIAACPMPARRGTPLRIERLTEALIARGHHVELITYHVSDDAQTLDFPVHRIFNRRVYWRMPAGPNLRKLALYDPALAIKVWRVLGGSRFDVMHAHHLEGLLVALPSRLRHGVPIVYDAHTMLSSELPSYGPSFTKRVVSTVGRWFDGVLPNAADHVASVTTDIRDRLTAASWLVARSDFCRHERRRDGVFSCRRRAATCGWSDAADLHRHSGAVSGCRRVARGVRGRAARAPGSAALYGGELAVRFLRGVGSEARYPRRHRDHSGQLRRVAAATGGGRTLRYCLACIAMGFRRSC